MRASLYLAVFVCLFFAAAVPQTAPLIDESKITAVFENSRLTVTLPVKGQLRSGAAVAGVEVLDETDTVVGRADSNSGEARSGAIRLSIPFTGSADELPWFRLRYHASVPDTPIIAGGIVSLSEVMPEMFELHVTAPAQVYSGMNVRVHVLAIHPYTQRPITGVAVSARAKIELDTLEDEDELVVVATGRTNADGIVSLDLRIPSKLRIDDVDLEVEGKKNGLTRVAEENLTTASGAAAFLMTDKPLYQPGQRLRARAMFLDIARKPIAGEELAFEIEDEEGKTVHEDSITTSRFGIAALEWALPEDLKLGKYTILVEDEDAGDVGRMEFRVSRYDLPNFTVTARPGKYYYLLDESEAEVNIEARYLFGKPVVGGTVKVVELLDRSWNFDDEEYDTDEGRAFEGTAKNDGIFTARLDLTRFAEKLREDEWRRFADLKYAAHYTDPTTNRTEIRRFDVRLSKESIHVYFVRPAADPNPSIPYRFYVSTFYADGTPAKAKLTIGGHYEKAATNEVIAEQRTNSFGAARFDLRFPQKPFSDAENEFNFHITAVDKDGRIGTLKDNVVVDPGSRQLRVITDKTVYAPGEPIRVRLISTHPGRVFVEIAKDASAVWSKSVEIDDGEASLTIPFRADFKGEMMVSAYNYNETAENQHSFWSKAVIYPSPRDVKVHVSGAKKVYRPGEDARLSFNVKGPGGAGAESALGVVLIDKSIEDRARTDNLPDNLSDVRKLLGDADGFGELRRRDLDRIDTTKPISEEVQLAAEYLLANRRYEPRSFASESYSGDFGSKYRGRMFEGVGPVIDAAAKHFESTADLPNGQADVARFLAKAGVDPASLTDAWGNPFILTFRKEGAEVFIEFTSASADKKASTDDDFSVGAVRLRWFTPTLRKIGQALRMETPDGPKPATAAELEVLIEAAGIDLHSITDDLGRPVKISTQIFERDTMKTELETVGNVGGERQQVARQRPSRQKVALHNFVGAGEDGIVGSGGDDRLLGSFVVVLSENILETGPEGKVSLSTAPTGNNRGAMGGTVTDMMGAVIPGATATAVRHGSEQSYEVRSNEEGYFLLAGLPSGRYRLTVQSPYFQGSVVENIIVSAYNLVTVNVTLEVGGVESVVEVTGSGFALLDSSSSAISTNVTRSEAKSIAGMLDGKTPGETFTPRVREYFPETLIWQPELLTDRNGRASIDLKFADSLTTWKLYTIASTEEGEVGFVEKEFETFQPFFAELDPPKVLTEGDRISLPVPVRNYTNRRQRASVTMQPNEWSSFDASARSITIEPNSTTNAIFDITAVKSADDGKQRVTAVAGRESDAVEKKVTVRPQGREVVSTGSENFERSAAFTVDFPTGATRANRSVILKIYPDMLAHVVESVDGLLKRPYGCGEQTTSSTYPNLLILKLEKDLGVSVPPATRSQAMQNLRDGYKRLLGYRTPSGGFSYWGPNDRPDEALTAYVIRFLSDAEDIIDVDDEVVEGATNWLAGRQNADGSWNLNSGHRDSATAYVVRALLESGRGDAKVKVAVESGTRYLSGVIASAEDPYVTATTALIAAKKGDRELGEKALAKLTTAATEKDGAVSWPARGTPFNGWGRAAEIETTAIALQALAGYGASKGESELNRLLAGGLKYVIAAKDVHGVWLTTQTTVNALGALTAIYKYNERASDQKGKQVTVSVNGVQVAKLDASSATLREPVNIDLTPFTTRENNKVEIASDSAAIGLTGAQIVSRHYMPWTSPWEESRHFDLKVACDKTDARVGDDVNCAVEMKRRGGARYGMVLTEIGLPPGADVDRGPLEAALSREEFGRYEVLPDRIVVYSFTSSTPMKFTIKFRPRYGIDALSPASVVYDYYNPEAQAVVAPLRFVVRQP